MEAHARSPRDLFEGKEHYEIPPFQRPYVWNEEDQWAPLWDDIVNVAAAFVDSKLADPAAPVKAHHFLGAVVYQSKAPIAGDVTRRDVIDGQQRMTTLQLLIDAVHEVIDARGHEDMAESLKEIILNGSARFARKPERFKVWPAESDRIAFERAMDGSGPRTANHPITEAHQFFVTEAENWIAGKPDEDGQQPAGTEVLRVEALSSVLQDRLILVAIDLAGSEDDAQLIFETLNDRGTPLLKADLIKNWVFREGERLGADVKRWASDTWAEFDDTWWRQELTQGRLTRTRIDTFVQYWLTMRRSDEIKAENVFRVFVEYAKPMMTSRDAADRLLAEMRRDADTYRAFAQLDVTTPEGRFYSHVIDRLELAAVTPVFLWLLSDNHRVPPQQRAAGLAALESWALRRTLLRMTTKDVNKFVIACLRMLMDVPVDRAGDEIVEYLSRQTAETRLWPSDDLMRGQLPSMRLYGSVRQDRIRVVLTELERQLRAADSRYEAVSLPVGLEIEHVMPQGWRTHWDTDPPLDPESAARRDQAVNTIGNLTLVTKSLNVALSNRPWRDSDAQGLKDGGKPDTGKRSLLDGFSLLALNKVLLAGHVDAWTDDDIAERSRSLTDLICLAWPGPDKEVQAAARAEAGPAAPHTDELGEIPWTAADVYRLANEVSETLLIVLDALSSEPLHPWSNVDFMADGKITGANGPIGGLTNKVRSRFGRSNSPIIFTRIDGRWHWSVSDEFAALWRQARRAQATTTW